MGSIKASLVLFTVMSATFGATHSGERVTKTDPTQSSTCIDPPATPSFLTTDNTVYLYFYSSVDTTDKLSNDWLAPDNTILTGGNWGTGYSGSYCFVGPRLSITNAPANWLGQWHARVWDNGTLLLSVPFNISAPGGGSIPTGPPTITGLNRSQFTPGDIYLTLYGINFQQGGVISVDYFEAGQFKWNVAPAVATQVDSSTQLRVHLSLPQFGEYRLIVQNPDQQRSPAPCGSFYSAACPGWIFLGLGGYKLPYFQGERWQTTQGNNEYNVNSNDHYDHHGHTAYAYDFADGSNKCVVAMKGGIVHTHDNHIAGPRFNSDGTCESGVEYGNYITIDTLDGEYSYYGHLAAGPFAVTDGQYVQQGQALATVGTTGCSTGYHVHVHVNAGAGGVESIYAQTVPFVFDDVPSRNLDGTDGPPPGQPVRPTSYTSGNSGFGVCNASNVSPPLSEADEAWSAIRARARSDSRFGLEIPGTQYLDPNWGKNDGNSSMRDLRSIIFNFSNGRTVKVYHAFYNNNTSNLGATVFYDPDANGWAPWIDVQP